MLLLLRRVVGAQEAANQAVLLTVLAGVAARQPAWLLAFVARAGAGAAGFVLARWLALHPLLRRLGHYHVKLSVAGLAALLLARDPALEALRCTLPTTSGTDTVSVPVPLAILRVLCQEYRRSDWQSTLGAVPLASTNAPGSALEEWQQNSDTGDGAGTNGVDEGEDEDEDLDDEEGEDFDLAFVQSRPLFKVDLARFLEDALRRAVQRGNGDFLTTMYWDLAPPERTAFRTMWSRATAPGKTP